MQYSTLLLPLLSITTLIAQMNVGDSLANLEILHEEHFPRPPFIMYFEKECSEVSVVNHANLLALSKKIPIFYVAVSQHTQEFSAWGDKYPVIIYDSYEGLSDEVGINSFPTTLVIGENYVVQKIVHGCLHHHCLDIESVGS